MCVRFIWCSKYTHCHQVVQLSQDQGQETYVMLGSTIGLVFFFLIWILFVFVFVVLLISSDVLCMCVSIIYMIMFIIKCIYKFWLRMRDSAYVCKHNVQRLFYFNHTISSFLQWSTTIEDDDTLFKNCHSANLNRPLMGMPVIK